MKLLLSGKISQTKVAKVKSTYRLLHNTLESTRESEIQLLGEAKRYRAELERLQAEVERTEEQSTSKKPESEVNELRQQLLQAYNELKAAEDREYKTQYKLICLREEKQYLEKENEIQPNLAELESRTKALQDKYEDLRKEVTQRQLEVRSLMEDVETSEAQILKEQKELEDKKEIIELKEKMEALNAEISEMEQHVKEVEQRNHSLRSKCKEMNEERERLRALIETSQRACRQLLKEQEVYREEEAELLGNRGILEMKLQDVMYDRKHLYDCHSVQLREKNRQMQALKRIEHTLKTANEQLEHTQVIYDELQAQQLNQHIQQELLEKDLIIMDHNKLNTTLQRRVSQYSKLCHMIKEEKNKYVNLKQFASQTITELTEQIELQENETEIKRAIVVNKDRSLTKARMKVAHHSQMRDKLRNDISKVAWKHRQVNQKCEDNKLELMKLTQMINHQEEALLEINKNHETAIQRRNSLGIQLLEHDEVLFNYYEKVNIQEAAITKGNMVLETLEKEIKDLQLAINEEKRQIGMKKKEVPLMKRMEGEITMLQIEDFPLESSSNFLFAGHCSAQCASVLAPYVIYVSALVSQESSYSLRLSDEENRDADRPNRDIDTETDEYKEKDKHQRGGRRTGEAKRDTDLNDQNGPTGQWLLVFGDNKLSNKLGLQSNGTCFRLLGFRNNEHQHPSLCFLSRGCTHSSSSSLRFLLSEARDKTIEALNRRVDYKELKGKDPSTLELVKKIEQLEVNLADSERQVLEKELLVDQVTRLTKPLSEQAENCQQDRLSLAKKLNELRAHIIDSNHRLMAVSAELSMKQAVALSLQQEIKEKEHQMDRCQQQLEQGLPPCPEIEEEWRRMLRDKKRRQRDKEERERSDSLPVPKPYGAQAPFKPSQPGANMRHIRKPTLEPVEM
ncbi:Coiled-coil domain-containing protein 146 [Collichthys lucidus]|uniref:Coiled-coil domain-containing protein 146 n=1 Tax=Collichthys lucidus TaxID=240159 RepID=A0A4U5VRP9_COLLU|nr:Coiled-coil domain-containing protein 146 [Collichthys lucidus]